MVSRRRRDGSRPTGRFEHVRTDRLPPSVLLGLLAAVLQAWAILPLSDRPIVHPDSALFMYGGGLLARGLPPYVYAFDVKPPLIYETLAVPNLLLPADPLVQFRAAVLLTGVAFVGFVVVTVRLVVELTDSKAAGVVAGATLLAYPSFYLIVALGPWVKHFALLVGVSSLYALQRRRSLLAGGLGAAAAGFWPMAVVFPAIVLVESIRRARTGDVRWVGWDVSDVRRVIGGAAATTAIVLAPFLVLGAGHNVFYEVVLFNLEGTEPFEPIARTARAVNLLGVSSFLVGIGAFGILWEAAVDRSRWWLLAGTAFAGVQVLFLDLDFYPDLFMLVFWVAVGAGVAVSRVDDPTARWVLAAAVVGTFAFALLAVRGALLGEMTRFVGEQWELWIDYRAFWEQTFPAETCVRWLPGRVEWARTHGLRLPEGCRFPPTLHG